MFSVLTLNYCLPTTIRGGDIVRTIFTKKFCLSFEKPAFVLEVTLLSPSSFHGSGKYFFLPSGIELCNNHPLHSFQLPDHISCTGQVPNSAIYIVVSQVERLSIPKILVEVYLYQTSNVFTNSQLHCTGGAESFITRIRSYMD